jgi:DNA-binding LacI/PurR family transcriptional regulator
MGHSRIAHISGAPNSVSAAERQAGYVSAMGRNGLTVDNELIKCGHSRRDGAAEAMKQLLGLAAPPTAVFCASDSMACAAMDVCRDRGIHVPGDISFVGADNTADGQYAFPAVSTVDVPRADIGLRAAEKLIGLIRGQPDIAPETYLPVELRRRASCAPARGAAVAAA